MSRSRRPKPARRTNLNSLIVKLIKMNETERITRVVKDFQDLIIDAATGTTIDLEKYEVQRDSLLSEPSIRYRIPEFVIKCRDCKQFWRFIKTVSPTYAGRREFIRNEFEPVFSCIESEGFQPVEIELKEILSKMNIPAISNVWDKIMKRKNDDPDGAITSAKTLLETVCKFILDEHKQTYSEKDDMPTLYKKTAQTLKINTDPKLNQTFLKIFSGCTSIVGGVTELRGILGDAHGKGSEYIKAEEKFASLAIGLAGSMTIFLLKSHLDSV